MLKINKIMPARTNCAWIRGINTVSLSVVVEAADVEVAEVPAEVGFPSLVATEPFTSNDDELNRLELLLLLLRLLLLLLLLLGALAKRD
jgi:hypothetical protein